MNILGYYKFIKPPFLEIGPLKSKEELANYFSGRKSELNELIRLNAWGGKYAALLTGSDGVGKTTLIRRFLSECSVSFYIKGEDIKNLSKIGEAEAEFNSKHISDMVVVSNIQSFVEYKQIKETIVIILDGQDFLERFDILEVATCCDYIREMVPSKVNFIYSSRDPLDELTEAFKDSRSRLSRTFDEHITLLPLGIRRIEDIQELLSKRFHTDSGTEFPFSEKTIRILEQFSSGNLRELLRSTRKLLQAGYKDLEKAPLSDSFCTQYIVNEAGSQIDGEIEYEILSKLQVRPMSVKDFAQTNQFGSERTVKRVLERLEERRFITRDHTKIGVKQEFSLLDKALILLEK